MLSPIDHDLQDLADDFDLLGEWEDRYHHLIYLGRRLEPLTTPEQSDANKVDGCLAKVWLITEPQAGRKLKFRGNSDSDLVRGLIAILIQLYSGRTAAEILTFDVKDAFVRLGFDNAITAQRSDGFSAMVQRIRRDAGAIDNAAAD